MRFERNVGLVKKDTEKTGYWLEAGHVCYAKLHAECGTTIFLYDSWFGRRTDVFI